MIGKESRAYSDILEAQKYLIEGVVISIDPSIGSSTSMPGYAIYRVGELVAFGIFQLAFKQLSIPQRLGKLHNEVRKLYIAYPPDVLIYEDIPAQRHGFGNAGAHASLLKAVGAILAVPGPTHYVGIMPVSWKAAARDTYTKGDREDAIEMGHVVISTAKEIQLGTFRKKKRK